MKNGKPFFFRLEPVQLLTALIQIPESDRGTWVTQVAIDLTSENPVTDFAQSLFKEAQGYQEAASERSRLAGLASAKKRQQASTDVERALTGVQQAFNEPPTGPNPEAVTEAVTEAKEKKKHLHVFFESLWKEYPSNDGKKEALRHFTATVKNEEDCERIRKSLDNYLDMLAVTPWRSPKAGKTWFNNWQDWEEETDLDTSVHGSQQKTIFEQEADRLVKMKEFKKNQKSIDSGEHHINSGDALAPSSTAWLDTLKGWSNGH